MQGEGVRCLERQVVAKTGEGWHEQGMQGLQGGHTIFAPPWCVWLGGVCVAWLVWFGLGNAHLHRNRAWGGIATLLTYVTQKQKASPQAVRTQAVG